MTLLEIDLFRGTFAFVQTRATLLLLLVVHSTRRIYKPDYDLSKNSFYQRIVFVIHEIFKVVHREATFKIFHEII